MEKFERLITERRTVHQYKPQGVSEELVHKALELSMWVPNHRLTFPWCYYLISDEVRKRFIDSAVEMKRSKDSSFSPVKEAGLRKRLGECSHWIALGLKRNADESIFREDIATLGCSVQTASLYLWEQGVATKWSTGGFTVSKRAYEILDINPEEVYLMGALFIGVADVIPPASPRPPLSEVLKRK